MNDTRTAIMIAALKCSRKYGLYRTTREQIARAAQLSDASVNVHFGTMAKLRQAVIEHIIRDEHDYLDVLAQGLAIRDPHAVKAPAALKRAALNTIA